MNNWYIGPWTWITGGAFPFWNPPAGFCALDLRPLAQQAQAGGTPGLGLFVGPGLITDSSFTRIGQGSWYDVKPTGRAKAAIPVRPGYQLQGEDLVGMLLDLLTNGADPDGGDGPKPIVPTVQGRLELHCGQSHHERFRWQVGDRYTNVLRTLLRKEFAGLMSDAQAGRLKDAQQHRRVLDYWCEKYGLNGPTDWKELVPDALQKDVPGRLPHATTYTDNFNRADADLTTGGAWAVNGGAIDISSNQVKMHALGGGLGYARYESDLSSADHTSQIDAAAFQSTTYVAALARYNSGAQTFYWGGARDFTGQGAEIWKVISGSFTNLASTGNHPSTPFTGLLTANGSAISYTDGTNSPSATDTAITGNLRAGFVISESGALTTRADNWQGADLGGAGGGILYTQLERGVRGMVRGTWGGFE